MVKACEADSLAAFAAAMRRLAGSDNREFAEQFKHFESSAKFCARMRSEEGAGRAVVDLKFSIAAADGVREKIAARAAAGAVKAKALLEWWDAVAEGEPTDENTAAAAANLIMNLPEVFAR